MQMFGARHFPDDRRYSGSPGDFSDVKSPEKGGVSVSLMQAACPLDTSPPPTALSRKKAPAFPEESRGFAVGSVLTKGQAIRLTTYKEIMPARVMTIFCPTHNVFIVVLESYPINSLNTQKKLLLT